MRLSALVLLTAVICVAGCKRHLSSSAPTWYESVDNTRKDPERLRAGEPELAGIGPFTYPLSREKALEVLLKSETFCSTAVGFAGRTPVQCFAFRSLLAEPDAVDAFGSLVRRGSPVGQLYGLCGLYLTDRARFDGAVGALRGSADPVSFLNGCIGEEKPVAQIVSEIESCGWPKAFQQSPDRPVADGK